MRLKNSNVSRNYLHITTPSGYSIDEDYSELYLSKKVFFLSLFMAFVGISLTFLNLINFWLAMVLLSVVFVAWCIIWGDLPLKLSALHWGTLAYGLISAAVLYLIFSLGNLILGALFDTLPSVEKIYALMEQGNPILAAVIILLIASPAEELFWHGFIQRALATKRGATQGILLSTLFYAAAYILTFNPLLIIAALVGGFVWAWLYQSSGNLWVSIISHSVWGLIIYIIFPLV